MKLKEVMERARFIKQGSRMVFVCDISELEAEDAMKVIRRSEDIVRKMPKKSVLALAYLVNVKRSQEIEGHIRHLLDNCAPHVLKAAYCNISDKSLKDSLERILPTSGSIRKTFDRSEDGLDWLVISEAK